MRCIITGCALVDEANMRWIWGDLYKMDDTIVHVAGTSSKVEWQHSPIPDDSDNTVYLKASTQEFFEKRGVSVLPIGRLQFNEAARKFLEEQGILLPE